MSAVDNGSSVNQASNHHIEGAVGLTRWQKPASSQKLVNLFAKKKSDRVSKRSIFCFVGDIIEEKTILFIDVLESFQLLSRLMLLFFFRGFEDEF